MHTELDVRSDTGQMKKNKDHQNDHCHRYYCGTSEVNYYLNGGAGEDDDEAFTFDAAGVEGTADVIG